MKYLGPQIYDCYRDWMMKITRPLTVPLLFPPDPELEYIDGETVNNLIMLFAIETQKIVIEALK
jgi:hypothetical protein